MTHQMIFIDYGNHTIMPDYSGMVEVVPFNNTLQDTLSEVNYIDADYVWITSSICDYENFKFNPNQVDLGDLDLGTVYVFSSDTQVRGDTFLLSSAYFDDFVSAFGGYSNFQYVDAGVPRHECPVFRHDEDTHVSVVQETRFDFPYAVFHSSGSSDDVVVTTPCMWDNRFKEITICSTGGTTIGVPQDARSKIKVELYDYPTHTCRNLVTSKPLDIIFYSNGESVADENWRHLLEVTAGQPNRVVRIDGVKGRVASQHAAALESTTPWYFLINAKLEVSSDFDWSWQPDRLQEPKHYIFRAINPVNGLRYGHMAMVANNRSLTLATTGQGLDFTMESRVCVVDIDSGIARFNTDPWTTWRTTFREVIKLLSQGDEESKKRLESWLGSNHGQYAEYCNHAANDASLYFSEVNGDFDAIKLTYEWDWLENRFNQVFQNVLTT